MAEKHELETLENASEEKNVGIPSPAETDEKGGLRTVDEGTPVGDALLLTEEQNSKIVLRKIDMRLIPLLSFLYL